jgi:hypothetical protein
MNGRYCSPDRLVRCTGLANNRHSMSQGGKRIGNQGGTKSSDPMPPAHLDDMANVFPRQGIGTEAKATAAIDLQIK